MGLFSRKKPQPQGPLPPVPRFQVPSEQAQPGYEPEFNQQQEHHMPEFPDTHPEPMHAPPQPENPPFPRPVAEERQQVHPAYVRPLDDRLPTRQEPLVRPALVVMPHPEATNLQPPSMEYSNSFTLPQQEPAHIQSPAPPQPAARAEIPVREPAFTRKPVQYPTRAAVAQERAFPWQREPQIIQRHFLPPRQEQPRPLIPDRPLPPPMAPPQPASRPSISLAQTPLAQQHTMSVEDKPLFIKIGQYREAMSNLELLKQKIKDAESALAKIEDLRTKEQTEITNAKTMLTTIKDKLLAIDKKLFEA